MGRRSKVSDAEIAEILDRRRKGETLHHIALDYGYGSRTAVQYVLKRHGAVTAQQAQAARDAAHKEFMERTLREGDATADPPEVVDLKLARDAQILRARAAGATLAEIGHRFGLTRERVRQIIDREGGPATDRARAARAARKVSQVNTQINT